MKKALHFSLGVFFYLGFSLVCPPLWACSCIPEARSSKQIIREAAAIFEGRVIKISADSSRPLGEAYQVTLQVLKSWKGVQSPEITVFTGTTGGDCGVGDLLLLNKSYLLLPITKGKDDRLKLDMCLTSFVDDYPKHQEFLKLLGAGKFWSK